MPRSPDDTNQAYADMAIRALRYEVQLRSAPTGPRRAHAQVILDELAQRYAERGYSYSGFHAAAVRLRKRGLLEKARPDGVIVRAQCCPCCGKEW